jgi:hypothetical protein
LACSKRDHFCIGRVIFDLGQSILHAAELLAGSSHSKNLSNQQAKDAEKGSAVTNTPIHREDDFVATCKAASL